MSHNQTLVGLDINFFANIYVGIIEKMVRYFKSRSCELDFDSLFLRLILKRKRIVEFKILICNL